LGRLRAEESGEPHPHAAIGSSNGKRPRGDRPAAARLFRATVDRRRSADVGCRRRLAGQPTPFANACRR
jgi:hypothetical protein